MTDEEKKTYYQAHKEERKEYLKTYYQDNKEEAKEYYQAHKEEAKEYRKAYHLIHKEEAKEYNKAHKKELKEYLKTYYQDNKEEESMRKRQKYCSEAVSKIENYTLAKADNFIDLDIHHRLETHNSDGERRLVDLTKDELKVLGMYYNRPASELIFMKHSEHISLHRKEKK